MNHRMMLSLALTVGLLLSLVTLPAVAQGQTKRKPIADTGMVTLAENQVLRVVGDWNGDGGITVQFRQVAYAPVACNAGVCEHDIVSQSMSAPVTLMPGQAASIDIESHSFGVRGMVLSDNPSVHVNAMVVDKTTGNIIAILVAG